MKLSMSTAARAASLSVLACACAASALAAPVSIGTPFINLENRNINSLGATPGQFLRIGAISVTPNGDAGTTGVGSIVLPDGTTATRSINFAPSPLNPNFFQRNMSDSPTLRGTWNLAFTNGSDTASRAVSISPTATQAPFVNSITLSGTSLNPTFSWTPPAGATVNAYRINIYDRALRVGNNSGQVANVDVPPSVTSHTVTARDFSVRGYEFKPGTNYTIEISLIQTKDGTGNSNNTNLQAIARSYADFTPNTGGGPPVNLPVVLENGSYKFDIAVVPGVTYYLDPEVAVGYDFAIGEGDPNFATLDLPESIGDGLFDIYGFDADGAPLLFVHGWNGRDVYDFGPGGVSRFRVTGIETSAGLDPANPLAFVTGVSFTGPGTFTGTQTPITVTIDNGTVPEPSSLALAALGLAGLMARRRSASVTAAR